jgi:hypothetical protein
MTDELAIRVQVALAKADDRTGFFNHLTPERIDTEIESILGGIFGLLMNDDLKLRLTSDLEKIGCRDIDVAFSPDGEVTATGTTILLDRFSAILHAGYSVP